ncbi:hypothetical protein UACE39S_01060 [Ureibacillus acetophenoni]
MGYYQLFILGSLIVLTIIVLIQSRIFKKNISSMEGMMISMYFCMNLSLTVGVLLGFTYQGNLIFSTVLTMLIGILVGLIFGSNFGILSVLDGVMAGIMGGMMGAMLGEMIKGDGSIILIRILLFLSISTIFLIIIITRSKITKPSKKLWLLKPIVLATLIIIYFICGVTFAENQINHYYEPSPNEHEKH